MLVARAFHLKGHSPGEKPRLPFRATCKQSRFDDIGPRGGYLLSCMASAVRLARRRSSIGRCCSCQAAVQLRVAGARRGRWRGSLVDLTTSFSTRMRSQRLSKSRGVRHPNAPRGSGAADRLRGKRGRLLGQSRRCAARSSTGRSAKALTPTLSLLPSLQLHDSPLLDWELITETLRSPPRDECTEFRCQDAGCHG